MFDGLPAIMVDAVTGKRASGGFDVVEQKIDFRRKGGMGENGAQYDTKKQGAENTGDLQTVN